MKGLLHRLAARAVGTASQMHSDVRLPFAAIEPGFSERVARSGGAAQAGTPCMSVVPSTQSAFVGEQRAPAEPIREREAVAAPTQVAAATEPEVPARARQVFLADKGLPPLRPPSKIVEARSSASLSQGEEAVIAPAAPARAERGTTLPQSPAQAAAIAALQPSPIWPPSPSEAPRRLLPETTEPQPTRPVRPSIAGADVGAAPRASTEPHEVHIHIGRIDVTAVHEPAAPPRRRAAAAPAPLSLDDYLARRNRS